MKPDHRYLNDLSETSTRVEPALAVDNPDAFPWDETCDALVVGVGLAGATAVLRISEDDSLNIIAIDRGLGGGASALSGGVIYIGGGTRVQQEAGVEDSPENMANYLKHETGDLVRPATLQRFAQTSASFLIWLESHGVRFGGPFTEAKTSYPSEGSCLYFSGNERSPSGKALATPAPRGHRAKPHNGKLPKSLSGGDLMRPLIDSVDKRPNVRFFRQTTATRLITDTEGAVIGVEVQRIPSGFKAKLHGLLYTLANKTELAALNLLSPICKGAMKLEKNAAQTLRVRVHKGVVLAAGGFTYNRAMMAKTAPEFLQSAPLGTIADDGSGIKLGMTAGAAVDRLGTVSAWRFLYPPASWIKSVSIGPDGQRLVCEEYYGARAGEAVFRLGGGKGWLILDAPLQAQAIADKKKLKLMLFQNVQLNAMLNKYTVSADTIPELAEKLSVPVDKLVATIDGYNRHIRENLPDPMGKSNELRHAIETGPFYATDIGAARRLSPIPALTMGGLVVDEDNGSVLNTEGAPIKGLYAAGRTAVGICSNFYVTGLSLADCLWSGWRAAETIKQQ
jgi:3-oxo-5alpha-steroid 4-dehydrogenase